MNPVALQASASSLPPDLQDDLARVGAMEKAFDTACEALIRGDFVGYEDAMLAFRQAEEAGR